MSRAIPLIFVSGLLYFLPSEVNCESLGPSAVVGGITQVITGLVRGSRVSNCFNSGPCRSICPSGQGVSSGTYCLFGRCFCQKGNVARRRSCRIPGPKLFKACTLPPGFNVIDTPLNPSVTILPDFDVCKASGRARGRSYCVFYTDFKNINAVGGPDPPGIPGLPVNSLPVPIPGTTKPKPPRRRRRKHKGRRPSNSPTKNVSIAPGPNTTSSGEIKVPKKEL